jgi:hypothetical protein
MLKRLIIMLALGVALLPASVSAVAVVTDLKGELIKGSQPAVYFYGEDGKRYVFPNEKIFYTWYSDFSSVREITDQELANIQIGGNVTYRPGTKLVKVTTDPRVYAVSGRGMLRWVQSEPVARSIYGEDWAKQVQDIPDAFFSDYQISTPIASGDVYKPETELNTYHEVSNVVGADQSTPAPATPSSVSSHTIVLSSTGGKNFSWTDTVVSPMGYKLVWSKNTGPTYPTREGDSYVYYGESSTKSGSLSGKLDSGVTYYVRVCEYLGGKCGAYSNQVTIVGTEPVTSNEEGSSASNVPHTIVLSSTGGKNFSWTDNVTSPNGYKFVYSKNPNPTYPTREGDYYAYYSDPSARAGWIETTEPGATYYVRVCNYVDGVCGSYSNQVTITAPAASSESSASDSTSHTIVLTSTGGKNFSWTDTAVSSLGYKLVWSKNTGPTYPTREGDTYAYYSDPNTKSGAIDASEAGATYYVRVCEYLGGKCGAYSNQVTITAPTQASAE